MKTRLRATRGSLLLVLFSLLLPSATSGTAAFSFDIDGDRAVDYELQLRG